MTASTTFLPPVLDLAIYRRANPDLSGMDEGQLVEHYHAFGEAEGRQANEISSRDRFVRLVDTARPVLEIGPFTAPLVQGPAVSYADIIDSTALRARADELGLPTDAIPSIDWVVEPNDLSSVGGQYATVVSSHVVEHQPDLVSHLRQVQSLLTDQGRYMVAVPDHRYCFDHFMHPSTVADVVGAWQESQSRHAARSVLAHRALITHNDPVRHWAGDHGDPREDRRVRLEAALEEIADAEGGHIDVHAWFFTPSSWVEIIDVIHELGLCELKAERTYPTVRNSNEFYSVLTLA